MQHTQPNIKPPCQPATQLIPHAPVLKVDIAVQRPGFWKLSPQNQAMHIDVRGELQ